MRKHLLFLVFILLFQLVAKSQTSVSGNISSNTTWTKANSPYIVVNTVIVNAGITLTIEPGVTVKFDSAQSLELLSQANLVALGTSVDSIRFTSNSLNPKKGIWRGVGTNYAFSRLYLDYCVFHYADTALDCFFGSKFDTVQHLSFYDNGNCIIRASGLVKNSLFLNNSTGILGVGALPLTADSCTFIKNETGVYNNAGSANCTNCIFINNNVGIYDEESVGQFRQFRSCIFCNNSVAIEEYGTASNVYILNCNFSQNHVGFAGSFQLMSGNIFTENDTALFCHYYEPNDSLVNNYIYHNKVGVLLDGDNISLIANNHICNNTKYNLQYMKLPNTVFSNTCWCDTDSTSIAAKIYDGHQNASLGLVKFTPFIKCDSSSLATIPPINCQTVVTINETPEYNEPSKATFQIYANASTKEITIKALVNIVDAQLKIYNLLGQLKYHSTITQRETTIDISFLASGMYIIEASDINSEGRLSNRIKILKP